MRPSVRSTLYHHWLRGTFPRRRFSSIATAATTLTLPELNATFPYRWLRDSCQCPACVHPSTRQKLHRSSDTPRDTRPADGLDAIRLTNDPEGLHIRWASSGGRLGDAHESFYPAEFLRAHASPVGLAAYHRDVPLEPWTADRFSSLTDDERSVPYEALSDPRALANVLQQLVRHGLVFLRDAPTTPTDDQNCTLRALAGTLGMLRKTFYGDTWDVRSVRNSKNIAYTNLDLGFHMDLMYFKEPPRYQVLHCLRNRVHGGHSIFSDGLRAALRLCDTNPRAFVLLATTPVHFHYVNDGHHLHHAHRTIALTPLPEGTPSSLGAVRIASTDESAPERMYTISNINYAPPFQAPLARDTPVEFYDALGAFAEILEERESRFECLMREGDVVVFDNRRVLHGRTAFVDDNEGEGGEEETNRWLKGCYLEEDAVLDRMRVVSAMVAEGSG